MLDVRVKDRGASSIVIRTVFIEEFQGKEDSSVALNMKMSFDFFFVVQFNVKIKLEL